MKKVLAYVILSCFLFNTAGYYLLFELDKYLIKNEMKGETALKEPADVIILKISNPELDRDFHRNDKREIEYKGMLYDVVREIPCGLTTTFICLHDAKEEGLFSGLKKSSFHKYFLALWDHVIKLAFTGSSLLIGHFTPTEICFPYHTTSLISFMPHGLSPPPEQF